MYMGRALSSGLSVSRGLSGRQWRWHPNACAAFMVFAAVVRNKDQPKSELSMDSLFTVGFQMSEHGSFSL